jgi:hypothetical protein
LTSIWSRGLSDCQRTRLPAEARSTTASAPDVEESDDRAGAVAGDGDPAWFGRELDAPADLEGRGVDGEELVIGDAGDQQGRAVGGQREAVRLGEREFARDRQAGARGVAGAQADDPVGGSIGDEDHSLAVADDLAEARVQRDLGSRGAVGAAAEHQARAALDHQQAVRVGEERAALAARMRPPRRRRERSDRRGLEEGVTAAAAGGRLTGEERERRDDEQRRAAHDWQSTRDAGWMVPDF